jgi:hypothetical protein
MVLYILTSKFLDSRREDRKLWTGYSVIMFQKPVTWDRLRIGWENIVQWGTL